MQLNTGIPLKSELSENEPALRKNLFSIALEIKNLENNWNNTLKNYRQVNDSFIKFLFNLDKNFLFSQGVIYYDHKHIYPSWSEQESLLDILEGKYRIELNNTYILIQTYGPINDWEGGWITYSCVPLSLFSNEKLKKDIDIHLANKKVKELEEKTVLFQRLKQELGEV